MSDGSKNLVVGASRVRQFCVAKRVLHWPGRTTSPRSFVHFRVVPACSNCLDKNAWSASDCVLARGYVY